jgi:hypothetical protein
MNKLARDGCSHDAADQYSLASLRYDLSKLRAKALVEKLPKSRRYRLWPQHKELQLLLRMSIFKTCQIR